MKYIFLSLIVFLSGCASPMPKMSNSDANANYDKDYYECSKEAERLISTYGSAWDNMMRPSRVKDKTITCMKARGWHEAN